MIRSLIFNKNLIKLCPTLLYFFSSLRMKILGKYFILFFAEAWFDGLHKIQMYIKKTIKYFLWAEESFSPFYSLKKISLLSYLVTNFVSKKLFFFQNFYYSSFRNRKLYLGKSTDTRSHKSRCFAPWTITNSGRSLARAFISTTLAPLR